MNKKPKISTTYLNLAGGKIKPDVDETLGGFFLLNLDTSYYSSTPTNIIEEAWMYWIHHREDEDREYYSNNDVYDFLSRTIIKFDVISIYRYLEHVPFDKVLFFIYLLSTVTEPGGQLDIIVPDYRKLARMILDENVDSRTFDAHNILLTTELLNEPSCPHASIWTVDRLDKFFKLEKRFKPIDISSHKFDGRDIYLRAIMERV